MSTDFPAVSSDVSTSSSQPFSTLNRVTSPFASRPSNRGWAEMNDSVRSVTAVGWI